MLCQARLLLQFHLAPAVIICLKKLGYFCLMDSDPTSVAYRLTVVFGSAWWLDCDPKNCLWGSLSSNLLFPLRLTRRAQNCWAGFFACCYLLRSWIFSLVRLNTYSLDQHARFSWRGRLSFLDDGWLTPTAHSHWFQPIRRSPRIGSLQRARPFHPIHKDAVNFCFSWIFTI